MTARVRTQDSGRSRRMRSDETDADLQLTATPFPSNRQVRDRRQDLIYVSRRCRNHQRRIPEDVDMQIVASFGSVFLQPLLPIHSGGNIGNAGLKPGSYRRIPVMDIAKSPGSPTRRKLPLDRFEKACWNRPSTFQDLLCIVSRIPSRSP